ncbi:hypothetical protein [Agrococcus sp. TSP3-2-1]|uniref:hypothetical protein n=1 Tax=Agrococcus sp. TSP3-2-1 TaxID=2804583 RepID=UPI003CEC2B8F
MENDEATDAVGGVPLHDGWATSTDLFQLDVWMARHAAPLAAEDVPASRPERSARDAVGTTTEDERSEGSLDD